MSRSVEEVKGKIIQITGGITGGFPVYALDDQGIVYFWSGYDRKWKEMGQ